MRAHLLLAHPGEHISGWPVASKAYLHEVAPEHGAGLDQPAHRRAMTGQVAVDAISGVGVCVEVNDADLAHAVMTRDPGSAGPRDRVVTAKDDGDDASARHLP